MLHQLVVNADDLGLTAGVNDGIFDAHELGILTSASIFANASATEDAIRRASSQTSLGIGVHLALVDGAPTLPARSIPTLVTDDGRFRRSWRPFIAACQRAGVPFKATAGLHHPLRAEYRLTYEPDSPKGTMHGYLNVFLAATLLYSGEKEPTALEMLDERDPAAFVFDDDGIVWRGKRVSTKEILASRSRFAISFGSCSFGEPIDELAQLTRRPGSAAQ